MFQTIGFQEPIQESFELLAPSSPYWRRGDGDAREEQRIPRTLAEM
jgi:hypothetical protein